MAKKRYTPEKIISMLREAEVQLAQGLKVMIPPTNNGQSVKLHSSFQMPMG
jgi:hypothetical protein